MEIKHFTNKYFKKFLGNLRQLFYQFKHTNLKSGKWYKSIGLKLIVSFIIPVCFVVIVGVASYNRASNAIVNNYKDSSLQAINMTGEFISFGLKSVEATASQYILDGSSQEYFYGQYDDKPLEFSMKGKEIKEKIKTKIMWDEFLVNIHYLSDHIDNVISTSNKAEKGIYQDFIESETVKKGKDDTDTAYWIGKDAVLDGKLGVDSEEYIIRYVQNFVDGDAVVLLDIKTSKIQDIIDRLDFGEGSVVSWVSAGGSELDKKGEDSNTLHFYGEDFYQKAFESDNMSGSENINLLGKNYCYLYSKIEGTGVMLCALIPEETMIHQVSSIKQLTRFLVLMACVIAIIVGGFIATGIQRVIHHIIVELKEVSKGNLTVQLNVKRTDEFSELAYGINNTIDNMRGLIRKIINENTSVTASSIQVREASEICASSNKGITDAIKEIEQGVTQQAEDSQSCLIQMDSLSQKIELMSGKTNEIKEITDITKQSISKGIGSMQVLDLKARSTAMITERIIKNIEVLETKSSKINHIVGTINSIAHETNLLSLNASIEAARAGEAGRGFAVVAEEIRKLADQSAHSAHEIGGLIKDIQVQTKEAVCIAKEADGIVKEQEEAVSNSEGSFDSINQHVEKLIDNVEMILNSIHDIETSRYGTLAAIENISAVSQQTAASSSSVSEMTLNQMEAIKALYELSKELGENAMSLGNAVDRFIL